ncbi:MAG: hypothetical protein ACLTR6_11375 [Clostridium fessum]
MTTAATRRYIREQAGSERSLTVGPEAMYEAEPFAAEASWKMVWRRMRRSHLLKNGACGKRGDRR